MIILLFFYYLIFWELLKIIIWWFHFYYKSITHFIIHFIFIAIKIMRNINDSISIKIIKNHLLRKTLIFQTIFTPKFFRVLKQAFTFICTRKMEGLFARMTQYWSIFLFTINAILNINKLPFVNNSKVKIFVTLHQIALQLYFEIQHNLHVPLIYNLPINHCKHRSSDHLLIAHQIHGIVHRQIHPFDPKSFYFIF